MHFYISDAILDLIQNSVEANSTFIALDIVEDESSYNIFISDNGKGISKDKLEKVFNPDFTEIEKHERRKFGLGLSFIKHQCELVDGKIEIDSIEGEGTSIHIELPKSHPDTPPLGELADLFVEIFLLSEESEVVINRYINDRKYELVKSKIVKDDMSWMKLLKNQVASLEKNIFVEVK